MIELLVIIVALVAAVAGYLVGYSVVLRHVRG